MQICPNYAGRAGSKKTCWTDFPSKSSTFRPCVTGKATSMFWARHFAMQMSRELGRLDIPVFTDRVNRTLEEYEWPGNIRELKNAVERAVYRSEGGIVERIELTPFINPFTESLPKKESGEGKKSEVEEIPLSDFREYIMDTEIGFIQRALEESRYSQKKAAQALGLTYDQFRGLYKKYQHLLKVNDY